MDIRNMMTKTIKNSATQDLKNLTQRLQRRKEEERGRVGEKNGEDAC